jgi:hypothetical protein
MRTTALFALICLPTFTTAVPTSEEAQEDVQQPVEGTTAATHSAALTARANIDMKIIATALDLYRLDNLKYPTTDQGLVALVEMPADSRRASHLAPGWLSSSVA